MNALPRRPSYRNCEIGRHLLFPATVGRPPPGLFTPFRSTDLHILAVISRDTGAISCFSNQVSPLSYSCKFIRRRNSRRKTKGDDKNEKYFRRIHRCAIASTISEGKQKEIIKEKRRLGTEQEKRRTASFCVCSQK